jgi:YD repeat-containing protein
MKVLENYAYQLADSGYFQGDETFARPVLKDILAPDGTRWARSNTIPRGAKTGLIDHEGNRVLFGYDAPEHHYTVTDRRGNPTEYTYDSDGNVTAVTDAEGHTETYSYVLTGMCSPIPINWVILPLPHTMKMGMC